jgi:hypothetical protein
MVKMQTFFRNDNQQIGRHGNPDLRLRRVLTGAEEHLDAQMLLDPFEEQLDLPTLAVQVGNQPGLEREVGLPSKLTQLSLSTLRSCCSHKMSDRLPLIKGT